MCEILCLLAKLVLGDVSTELIKTGLKVGKLQIIQIKAPLRHCESVSFQPPGPAKSGNLLTIFHFPVTLFVLDCHDSLTFSLFTFHVGEDESEENRREAGCHCCAALPVHMTSSLIIYSFWSSCHHFVVWLCAASASSASLLNAVRYVVHF